MSEIYWITRLDAICSCFIPIAIISTILVVVGIIGYIYNTCAVTEYETKRNNRNPTLYNEEISEYKGYLSTFTKILKASLIFVVFSYVGLVFIPSTKEAMLIYGIGGTIDYIKSNDKAKQLPDKCIDALTRYVDSIEKENTESKK